MYTVCLSFSPLSLFIIHWHCKQLHYIILFSAISNSSVFIRAVFYNLQWTYCMESLIHSRGSCVVKTLYPQGSAKCQCWINKDRWVWAFPSSHQASASRAERCVSWDPFVLLLEIATVWGWAVASIQIISWSDRETWHDYGKNEDVILIMIIAIICLTLLNCRPIMGNLILSVISR